MLSGENRPSAVFCTSDLIAMGVMDAARCELNLKIPGDLSVIGYDDIEMAGWKAYDLSTVHQPIDELIEKTVHIVEQLLANEEKKTYIEMVKPVLVKRNSVLEK